MQVKRNYTSQQTITNAAATIGTVGNRKGITIQNPSTTETLLLGGSSTTCFFPLNPLDTIGEEMISSFGTEIYGVRAGTTNFSINVWEVK